MHAEKPLCKAEPGHCNATDHQASNFMLHDTYVTPPTLHHASCMMLAL